MTADHITRAAEVLARVGCQPDGEPSNLDQEYARALDAAGLLVTPEHDAAVAAEAWSEGVIAGYKDRIRDEEDPLPGGYLHHTPNPYEREAGESDADA